MVCLTIRIDFDSDNALGLGKVHLFEEIENTGSIRGAAIAMKMGYLRTWLLLKAVENTFGTALISRLKGGQRGGWSGLTKLGTRVVRVSRDRELGSQRSVEAGYFLPKSPTKVTGQEF